MKAKVKGTNEIVEVKPNGTSKTIHMSCSEFISEDGRVFPSIYLDIINEVDWEARRYEIAKAIINGWASDEYGVLNGRNCEGGLDEQMQFYCKRAVKVADVLIAELKKKGESV